MGVVFEDGAGSLLTITIDRLKSTLWGIQFGVTDQ